MTTVTDTSLLDSLGLTTRPTEPKAANDALAQEDFLQLMTAQLKNQDPFKPLESGEFLGQIAQFGTVSGIQELQSAFNQFSSALLPNQALQAASLVGRSVLAQGDTAQLVAGSGIAGAVELPQSAGNVTVSILDAGGQVVKRIELGAQKAGLVPFGWDGYNASGVALPPGSYTVQASALVGNTEMAVGTLISSQVESVELLGAKGLTLNVAGRGALDFSQVRQIY